MTEPGTEVRTLVQARGLSKVFAGQRALDDVDLDLRAGEVHALLGANGSGKSTLIKILAGYHEPEPGAEVMVRGEPLALGSPPASHRAGLRFIHQDLGLIPTLSVADNLMLGGRFPSRWWTSDRLEQRWARSVLERHGVDTHPAAPVLSLKPSQQSLVAIVRAVEGDLGAGGLLVLDEPTASLPAEEVRHLFALIEGLKARGVAILYVTHRLPEVFRVADRVTVLRDGRRVATKAISELDHDSLIELILGHRLEIAQYAARETPGAPLLDVRGLSGGTVTDATFAAREGEVLGLTGLMGSGYEAVLGLVYGAQPARAGTVDVDGHELRRLTPRAAIRAGLAYAPADRRRLAAVVDWTLRENLTMPRIPSSGALRWLSPRREAADARPWLDRLAVSPSHPERQFSSLSGGNQQKLVLARWLRCGAKVFLLDEPTFGVDAGAKRAIYRELRTAAAEGAAVVISSSDTEELCEVCDRVLVLGDGVVRTELPGSSNPDEIFAETLRASRGAAPGHVLAPTAR